jgi:hypothetical protein
MPEAYFNQAFPELSSKDRAILFSLEHRSQFSGNVDVTRNLLANQVKIKFGNGTIVSKDHAGEKAIHSIGETLYTIQLKHLFNLNQLSIKDIQSLSVESKNVVLTDEKNNVLLSSKRMLFTLRDTAIKNQKVMYTLTAKEQETRINNDYVQWFTALESYKILYQMLGQPRTVDLTDTQNKKSDPIARLPSLFPGIQLTQAQIQFAIPHLHELGGIVLNRMVIV